MNEVNLLYFNKLYATFKNTKLNKYCIVGPRRCFIVFRGKMLRFILTY